MTIARVKDLLLALLIGAVIAFAVAPVSQASYGLPVKTIQCGTIAVNNGSATGTSTLSTAVTVAKTFVVHLGHYGGTNLTDQHSAVSITNTTTITGTREGTTGNNVTGYCAIEFY